MILLAVPELGKRFKVDGEDSPEFDDIIEWGKILFTPELTVNSGKMVLLLIPGLGERTDGEIVIPGVTNYCLFIAAQ